MVDLMEYIKIQWTDIHHMRNQDWKVLVIILGIFYALFKVNPYHISLHLVITILGLIVSGMGIYMSIIHWLVFYSKRKIITECEKKLGIEVSIYKHFFPVQSLIVLIYFFIFSTLSGWLIWLISKGVLISLLTFIICFVIGFNICIIAKIRIINTVNKRTSVTFKF